jgi:transcriptional regulator with XRE-family HTH domain
MLGGATFPTDRLLAPTSPASIHLYARFGRIKRALSTLFVVVACLSWGAKARMLDVVTAADDLLFEYIRLRLRSIRRKKRLTAEEVAVKAGLSRSTYSTIETGASRPSILSLYRILGALKTDISSVWPNSVGFSSRGLVALSTDNLFRFREVILLTEADSACLLLRRQTETQVLAQFNLEEQDWPHLLELIKEPAEQKTDWKCRRASTGRDNLFLCLRNIQQPDLARLMSDVYLPAWLAAIRFGAHELDVNALDLASFDPYTVCEST